jgi:hypothetical protein
MKKFMIILSKWSMVKTMALNNTKIILNKDILIIQD